MTPGVCPHVDVLPTVLKEKTPRDRFPGGAGSSLLALADHHMQLLRAFFRGETSMKYQNLKMK